MPRADGSLQEKLASGQGFDESAAVDVLLQILFGLDEVADIVHRDLKPGNVLYHEGVWKIADFGIARFVEESTSARTLNNCLSPPYAAPEQWREERATSATDIYALGCIAYAMLTGRPPFAGRSREEFKVQHINAIPAAVTSVDPRLTAVLSTLLRKTSEARPSRARLRVELEEIKATPTPAAPKGRPLVALAAASAHVAENAAAHDARRQTERAIIARRQEIFDDAVRSLRNEIVLPMLETITRSAPNVHLNRERLCVTMGPGFLGVEVGISPVSPVAFPNSGWEIYAAATVSAAQIKPDYRWEAALWFGRIAKDGDLRWYEVSYMDNPACRTRRDWVPFALNDDAEIPYADEAASPVMGKYQHAFGPSPIDGEGFEAFFGRWVELFSRACKKELGHPRMLPLPSTGI